MGPQTGRWSTLSRRCFIYLFNSSLYYVHYHWVLLYPSLGGILKKYIPGPHLGLLNETLYQHLGIYQVLFQWYNMYIVYWILNWWLINLSRACWKDKTFFFFFLYLVHSVGGNADWYSHSGKQYGVSHKIKNGTAFWPSDSTSGNLFKESQNTNSKEYMHPYVHRSIIYNSQGMEIA